MTDRIALYSCYRVPCCRFDLFVQEIRSGFTACCSILLSSFPSRLIWPLKALLCLGIPVLVFILLNFQIVEFINEKKLASYKFESYKKWRTLKAIKRCYFWRHFLYCLLMQFLDFKADAGQRLFMSVLMRSLCRWTGCSSNRSLGNRSL